MSSSSNAARVRKVIREVKPLAREYYRLTGRPLGVTAEIAEQEAARILKLELLPFDKRDMTPSAIDDARVSYSRSRGAVLCLAPAPIESVQST